MTTSSFDPVEMLRVLSRAEVKFVVIGGYAAELLGAPLMTMDLDVCYERTAENMERLAAALRQLGAKLRVAKVDEDLPFLLDGRTLAAGDSFTFITDLGSLDVLGTPSGTKGFRDLVSSAVAVPVADDLSVRVVAHCRPHAHEAGQRSDQGQDAPRGAQRRCKKCWNRRRRRKVAVSAGLVSGNISGSEADNPV